MARDARQMDPATLLCERCGYVIEGLDERGACPECGKPIAESVPERRTGVPIEPDADGKVNWWRAAWAVLWRPGETFERVRINGRMAIAFRLFSIAVTGTAMGLAVALAQTDDFGYAISTDDHSIFVKYFLKMAVIAVPVSAAALALVIYAEGIGLRMIARTHSYRVTPELRSVIVGYSSVGWIPGSLVPIFLLLLPTALNFNHSGLGLGEYDASIDSHRWLITHRWAIAACSLIVPLFLFELLCYIGIRRCKFANQPRIRSAVPGAGGSTSVPPASE